MALKTGAGHDKEITRLADAVAAWNNGLGEARATVTGGEIFTYGNQSMAIWAFVENPLSSANSVATLTGGTIYTEGTVSHGIFSENAGIMGDAIAIMSGGSIYTEGVRASAIRSKTTWRDTYGPEPIGRAREGNNLVQMTGGDIRTIGNGANGIIAENQGTGSISIQMSGGTILAEGGVVPDTTLGANGIFAWQNLLGFATHGQLPLGNVDVTLSGEARVVSMLNSGIRVELYPNNPNEIEYNVHVLGNAHVSGGSGGIRTLSGLGDKGDIRVGQNATVLGGIYDTDGDATALIGGTIDGAVSLGRGQDRLTINASADISDVTQLDGGVDHSGAVDLDILTFDGWSGALEGGNLINWAQIVLDGGADINFGPTLKVGVDGDDIAETGMGLFVEAGSTLRASGGLSLTGNLINRGLVTMIDDLVGDVVTVSGNYSSNSTLAFDVDFGAATADRLIINGDVLAGSQAEIVVNAVGGAGTGQRINLIRIIGDNGGNYALVDGPIDSGVWRYNLFVDNDFVDLVAGLDGSNPINTIGAVYETAPFVLLSGFARLPTLEQRVGQRQWLVQSEDGVDGVWLRLHGERARVTPRISDSAASYRSTTWGLQLGADMQMAEGDSGYWVLGVTGQYGRISADISNALGEGRITGTGYGLGATATWHGVGGTYLDLQGQVNRISAAYSTAAHGMLASSQRATAYALSAELGHRYALDDAGKHALVPQAQLSWGQVKGSAFTDSRGNAVVLGTSSRTIGRIGMAYEYRPNGMTQGQRADDEQMVYGIVNILRDFSPRSSVDVAGTPLQARAERTWGELGLGGSIEVAPNALLYGEASYRQALSGGGSGNRSVQGTLGLRFQW